MSCQSNANRTKLAAARCGLGAAANKTAYVTGVIAGSTAGAVAGGAAGAVVGAVGSGAAGAVAGTFVAGPLGTIPGAAVGAVTGGTIMAGIGGAAGAIKGERGVARWWARRGQPNYGGGLGYHAAVGTSRAMGTVGGAAAGAMVGAYGGPFGIGIGTAVGARLGGRASARNTARKIKMRRWRASAAGQRAIQEYRGKIKTAVAQRQPGIRGALKLTQQWSRLTAEADVRARREAWGTVA